MKPSRAAVMAYFKGSADPELMTNAFFDAFDSMMEGAAFMLDVLGKVEGTYVTKSGNKVHIVLDSPNE